VIANECVGAFFWPIAFRIQPSVLWCTDENETADSAVKGQPQVSGPQVKYTYTEWLKIPQKATMDSLRTLLWFVSYRRLSPKFHSFLSAITPALHLCGCCTPMAPSPLPYPITSRNPAKTTLHGYPSSSLLDKIHFSCRVGFRCFQELYEIYFLKFYCGN
jgi:hypothetical protein